MSPSSGSTTRTHPATALRVRKPRAVRWIIVAAVATAGAVKALRAVGTDADMVPAPGLAAEAAESVRFGTVKGESAAPWSTLACKASVEAAADPTPDAGVEAAADLTADAGLFSAEEICVGTGGAAVPDKSESFRCTGAPPPAPAAMSRKSASALSAS
jgi:hypothetical protein